MFNYLHIVDTALYFYSHPKITINFTFSVDDESFVEPYTYVTGIFEHLSL